jgi:hypothetical protein
VQQDAHKAALQMAIACCAASVFDDRTKRLYSCLTECRAQTDFRSMIKPSICTRPRFICAEKVFKFGINLYQF